ncbi:unnamed protein product [Psylliodes chrysocephalus]|uniref:Uncharacterized protein n=1 Tax=Psylliodes chrysocephalus TaxID=3402493 RepID=A0A9P0D7I8_9CUCU|nr:unnamed protein product [Psylliodes chrysocephala]
MNSENPNNDEGEDNIKYTNEQKIVAAVWIHETVHNNQTLDDIKNNFKIRFKLKPPKTTDLIMWENQLFSKGEIKNDEQTDEDKDNNLNIDIDDELSDGGSSEDENSD